MSKREFTKAEIAQVRKLIRSECCNYDDGNCMILFDGCERTCPQSISLRLICRWFIEAVLPLDSKLQIALKTAPDIQTSQCELCGKEIIRKSNRTKYCDRCAIKIRRKNKAEYMARKRGMAVDI